MIEDSSKDKEEESIPSWARPDSDEPPPWARDEASQTAPQQSFQIPLFIGFVFEYLNQKPIFGVLSSNSVFYAPLLGFFVFTGIPTFTAHSSKTIFPSQSGPESDTRDMFDDPVVFSLVGFGFYSIYQFFWHINKLKSFEVSEVVDARWYLL
ncbi:hypothetical protein TEA_004304 [Camellia sinensis var. sinensis]|uniref:Uncharacterized protein n=1 Tax=Camellia sinensis var. sinensis TaxID=542762 RepID=A0A4S4EY57_CAMSN|nr:hypothetical protein TEA_004304 [Camellia sinensis var. sinensis]